MLTFFFPELCVYGFTFTPHYLMSLVSEFLVISLVRSGTLLLVLPLKFYCVRLRLFLINRYWLLFYLLLICITFFCSTYHLSHNSCFFPLVCAFVCCTYFVWDIYIYTEFFFFTDILRILAWWNGASMWCLNTQGLDLSSSKSLIMPSFFCSQWGDTWKYFENT